MTSQPNRFVKGLFFCLISLSLFHAKALALDKNASFALSHYIMGIIYEDLGNIDEAIQEYTKALKVERQNSVLRLNLASTYIKKNDIPKAIEELKSAISLDAEAIEPHAILAILYSAQNKPDLATVEYEQALQNAAKLQPQNVEIYKSLGAIYLQQKKFQDAQNAFSLLLKLSPDYAQGHLYLGSIYSELDNEKMAEEEIKKALEIKPDYPEALNFLGYLYVEKERNLEQAEALIRKALELDPNNGAYLDSLGWLYFKKGKPEQALEELVKASSKISDPVVFDHLGDVYLKINDIPRAKFNWEKSLQLDPEQKKIKEKLEKLITK